MMIGITLYLMSFYPFRVKMKKVKTVFDYEIQVIRKMLKSIAPTISVRRDRGTAYGWIVISGSLQFGEFTEQEKKALETLGLSYGANYAVISPESRRYYVEKAAKLLGIPLPQPVKKEYEERDRQREEYERRFLELKKKQETCEHEFVVQPYLVLFPSNAEVWKCKKCGLEKVVRKTNRPR